MKKIILLKLIILNILASQSIPYFDSEKAFDVLNGMKTLEQRMMTKVINTQVFTSFLNAHNQIRVNCHALPEHENAGLREKQHTHGWPCTLFTVDMAPANLPRDVFVGFFDALEPAFSHQVSIGQNNTIVLCPALTSHSELSSDEQKKAGIELTTMRIAMGTDNVKQLIQEIILRQNPKFKNIFENEIKTWPLYFTPKIIPSSNKKVFYIGDAFNGFLPTLAQGAGQSIESAFEIFNLLTKDKLDKENNYFEIRSKRAKIIRSRSNFNFFAFHFSSKIMQNVRNLFLKFLVKRKFFVKRYLGKVYKN